MFTQPNLLLEQIYNLTRHTLDMATLWNKLAISNLQQYSLNTESYVNFTKQYFQLILTPNPQLNLNALEYVIDHFQRSILFLDVIRKRGNQYLDHIAKGQPPVLIFKYNILMDGRDFERPVNYVLVEIKPPKDIQIQPHKRPYLIVDPRAGHGSGIGGFKDDSQVGIALRSGHPVYFVIFYSEPEPGQTLHDITIAEEKFLQMIANRHPASPKPCIIGNCQGGWAAMALAAAHPDCAGVVVINGAPLSYWAGENGKNPMRYAGGILGGSWLAQFAGDLGNGKFDGAHLVANFEFLNPAENFWNKYYNLFVNVDKEEKRYLDFEKWWGGFSLLNTREMRSIVDNLFIGNKLAHGKVSLDNNSYIDLRNIQLPIIIFCSKGDNISPPQQALNWIADSYTSILELKLARQVIVYTVDQTIGHLGLFVSGNIVKKVHRQIVDLLNYVEHLPPGLYEMIINEDYDEKSQEPLYSIKLEERQIEDIVDPENQKHKIDEEIFNIVRAISDFNSAGYDLLLSPWVRSFANDYLASLLRELHPLRSSRYVFSNRNPYIWFLTIFEPLIRSNRYTISDKNPFLDLQKSLSNMISTLLTNMTLMRDTIAELSFYGVFGFLHAVLPKDLPFRSGLIRHIEGTAEEGFGQQIVSSAEMGGTADAIIRILLLLIKSEGFAHGEHFSEGIKILKKSAPFSDLTDNEFRSIVQHQTLIVEYDAALALQTLPRLLKTKQAKMEASEIVHQVIQTVIKTFLPNKAQTLFGEINKLLTS